jgi:hypothetical protein
MDLVYFMLQPTSISNSAGSREYFLILSPEFEVQQKICSFVYSQTNKAWGLTLRTQNFKKKALPAVGMFGRIQLMYM